MDLFLLKIALSFIAGGLFCAFSIWVAEKLGPKVGGIVMGLPSTVLVAIVFITWTQGIQAAQTAATTAVVVIGVNSIFAVVFGRLSNKGLRVALLGSLLIWFILVLPLKLLLSIGLFESAILSTAFILSGLWLSKDFKNVKLDKFKFSKKEFITRTIVAGVIISLAVLLSNTMGPVWGGIAGSFPAVYLSALVLLFKSRGPEFTKSLAKAMPLGNSTTLVFLIVFSLTVLSLNPITSFIVSYTSSVILGIIIYVLKN